MWIDYPSYNPVIGYWRSIWHSLFPHCARYLRDSNRNWIYVCKGKYVKPDCWTRGPGFHSQVVQSVIGFFHQEFVSSSHNDCGRLFTHVVFVVGFVCFDAPWDYAVEPLMPDKSTVSIQTKRDTGVYAVRGRPRFASGPRLLIRRACASKQATAKLRKSTPAL